MGRCVRGRWWLYGRGLDVSYPRRMPDIPQLVAAIDGRLAEISAEMTALGAAKTELAAPRADNQAPGVAARTSANQSPGRAASRRLTPPPRRSERSLRRRVSQRIEATRDAGRASTPQRSTRKPTTTVRPDSGDGSVEAESLERLLAEIPAGLTANAVAQRAGAGYSRTLRLLHELEAAGRVRRSGARRSTVWQLITDEDRIAQRAAELERLRSTPSRRGRARAS
jgi:hypothetical protein